MSCKKVWALSNQHLHQKPLAKSGNGKQPSTESTTSVTQKACSERNSVTCARNMRAYVQCTTSECPKYEKMGKRKSNSCAARKGTKKLVSSNYSRNLEEESSKLNQRNLLENHVYSLKSNTSYQLYCYCLAIEMTLVWHHLVMMMSPWCHQAKPLSYMQSTVYYHWK